MQFLQENPNLEPEISFLDVPQPGRGTSLTDIVVVLSRVGVSQLGSDDG